MPRIRFFGSPTNEWVSPLVVVARSLVSVGNCLPFPYVNTALSSGLALLELIQTVGQSGDDLKYLAESVVTIMKLLREEMDSHTATENTKFLRVCEEFTGHLDQLSKDLESMSKNWSSSKFKKYLKSHNIREEIALFTRRVADLRANATLIAAAGARLDLAGVVDEVAAVQSRINDLQNQLVGQSLAASAADDQELTRFEEDFHSLKLGDIYLDFRSALVSEFPELDHDGREKRRIGWTDYKATVNGCVRTVRVYGGSDPAESWKGFLSFLAENSPSPHLPQLFGFCSSPRLRSLVFHGEYRSLDEYGNALPSAQAIVDWELSVVVDVMNMFRSEYHDLIHQRNRPFAMINTQDRKLVLSYVEEDTSKLNQNFPPFLTWLIYDMLFNRYIPLTGSEGHLRDALGSIVDLCRRSTLETPFCRGCVHHHNTLSPVAQLEDRLVLPEESWRVYRVLAQERGTHGSPVWPSDDWFPVADTKLRGGFTKFTVPLAGVTQRWISMHDYEAHCGYFLNAEIEFGKSLPDITHAWMAQAGYIRSKLKESSDPWDTSEFYVPTRTALYLEWEMSINISGTPDSTLTLNGLPDEIHVFVQVPTVHEECVEEPQIYWSTDSSTITTGSIPPAALTIKMRWRARTDAARWEPHHYEVAEAILRRHGFDPTTDAAAQSLNLPLLELASDQCLRDEPLYWLG